MKKIEAQSGTGFIIRKGQNLKITDPEGQQVSDFYCFNQDDLGESFSAGRSIDYAENIYLSRGNHLYSNRSRVMMTITEDSCGRHDLLMTPCSLEMFQIVADNELYHKSCQENLEKAFAPFHISADRLATSFNIFMNVQVTSQGQIKIRDPLSRPGDFIVLKAEQNLIVGLTACSHEGSNAGHCKPILWEIF